LFELSLLIIIKGSEHPGIRGRQKISESLRTVYRQDNQADCAPLGFLELLQNPA
jgi:hypothetical protein